MSTRILCVDPDERARQETAESLRTELSDLDPSVETAGTVEEALDRLTPEHSALLTEQDLPDGTGVALIDAADEIAPDAGAVLYTDADPAAIDTDALRGSVTEYVGKGSVFGAERLGRLVRTTVDTRAQASYPLPQNEAERVAALQAYDLDDPAPMATLDRITGLAARHFAVEQASVNLIGAHSQEFLSCYGGATEWETTDREDSICTFTILADDVMTVSDVTEDPRFESRSEALAGMGIRSYMGANLVTPAGLVVGTLCVYDDDPRSFSTADETYLRDLATVAMDVIDLHARADAPEGDR